VWKKRARRVNPRALPSVSAPVHPHCAFLHRLVRALGLSFHIAALPCVVPARLQQSAIPRDASTAPSLSSGGVLSCIGLGSALHGALRPSSVLAKRGQIAPAHTHSQMSLAIPLAHSYPSLPIMRTCRKIVAVPNGRGGHDLDCVHSLLFTDRTGTARAASQLRA